MDDEAAADIARMLLLPANSPDERRIPPLINSWFSRCIDDDDDTARRLAPTTRAARRFAAVVVASSMR